MARAKKLFEVEACMWARGRIPASSEKKAVETLFELMWVDEGKLNELTSHDFDVGSVGASERQGGINWEVLNALRQNRMSTIEAEIEAEDKAKATSRKRSGPGRGAAPAHTRVDRRRQGAGGQSESEKPSGTVVSIGPRLAQRRFEKDFPIEREFAVAITWRKGGIIGFRFEGIDLTEGNIDDVQHDVQTVADCLRNDRASFLEDDD
jgi:hypothetical protein